MWSPWRSGSPQNVASFAFSGMSSEDGTAPAAPAAPVWNGPPTSKKYEPTQTTIQLSMIVVITSWAPTVPFRRPAMPAMNAPASIAPSTITRISRGPGRLDRLGKLGRDQDGGDRAGEVLPVAADVEEAAAERERDREAREHEHRPEKQRLLEVRGRLRGEVVRVPREPDAAVGERDADVVAADLEEPVEARAAEDRPVRLQRVDDASRRQEHDDAADQERQQQREHGRDAGPPPSGGSGSARPGSTLGLGRRLLRRRLDGLAHAASFCPPPVMATPSSSAVAVGGNSPDDLAFEDDEDAIGEREDLLELERDEQDRPALVALLDQATVDELDRADVEPARRLGGDEHARIAVDLAGEDDLLLVAAREVRPPSSPGAPPRTSNSAIRRRARSTRRAG